MNQAALHRLVSSKSKKKDLDTLFELRLATNLTLIKDLFLSIYPDSQNKAFENLLLILPKLFEKRPQILKKQDIHRIEVGNWYQSEKLMGMQLYVDHFNKNLKGLQDRLSYFEDLGVNFLHLMPITTRPKGENDGGYAVNSYTKIDKQYGTKKDLQELTSILQKKKMYLMLDFVVNHTSDEHQWAKKAKAGDKKYQAYYYSYADQTIPKEFEKTLPEVFPETSPGNFTYIAEMEKWVMTVFNSYQWDLNYTNPNVFIAMLSNLVELSNLGVDVVRFDALAFLSKKLGTNSQNLPQAHNIISLFRMCLQVIAPGTILLAEAIVAPSDIVKYFGEESKTGNECEIAYNASLMALLWNSIATKKTALLHKSLTNAPKKPVDGTWVNYIRCHDDIGLGLDNQFINELGWNPQGHRKFLLDYYCQRLDWSPAKGLSFMYNPKTGDGRITGSAASLLGLEKGLQEKNSELIRQAIDKIIMMHGIILSFGGIPLIYAGDEIGTLNDYSFLNNANKKEDSRWVNRPQQDWNVIDALTKKTTPQTEIYHKLKKMIAIRKKNSVFADKSNWEIYHTGNEHIMIFERSSKTKDGLLVIANFDNSPQVIDASWISKLGYLRNQECHDLITYDSIKLTSGFLEVNPYQLLWLQKD
ncbi:alpha-amylase family protein [Croceitalea rosinachiae]|uniref:Alpha-amylase family protein n=1 Tax=Croceitalea rosinachiae TaxID=3075596 RepID=A0ABU3A8G6_9FLAO|nr:alpha-amylase family protein [Croceitalea sp. F388]MDT0606476.1 alpha-amylase family protein [Croceitalea sp. F388]